MLLMTNSEGKSETTKIVYGVFLLLSVLSQIAWYVKWQFYLYSYVHLVPI